ncbi:hypothetical protein JKF63_04956 [Porcisia hertigi]|uniref:NADH dehydrogenase subunit 4 n=1 Tax=Porcisia hertigi TaxID=2761500 RepID=A0A836I7T0_9TRYP|nr:hypothetical protein JKF63_04956 [Porcisia hertigi]
MMLYVICISLLTFLSTFMVADTVSNTWPLLSRGRVALTSCSVWVAAFVLTMLGADNWLMTLGLLHAVTFCFCGFLLRGGDNAARSFLTHDFVRFPVVTFLPALLMLYMLGGWLQ